jgi:hypothetical protein
VSFHYVTYFLEYDLMEHNRRWLNQTRLNVNRLEDRVTPGSMLLSGLNLSLLSDTLPRTQSAPDLLNVLSAKKVEDDSTPIISVTPSQAQGAESHTAPSSTLSSQFTTGLPVQTATPAAPARTLSVNPAFHTSGGAVQSQIVAPAQHSTTTGSISHKIDALVAPHAPTKKAVPVKSTTPVSVHQMDPSSLRITITPCDAGNKVFTPVWNTYDGGANAGSTDAINAVATGKGGNTGVLTYGGGVHGVDGFIRSYNAVTGACGTLVTISDAAGVTVHSLAVDTQGVYAAVNLNDGSKAFILQFKGDLSAQTAALEIDAGAGQTVTMKGVGISPNGQVPDVYGVGGITGVSAYSDILAIRADKTLATTTYATAIDFGSDSEGKMVAADRPHNAYIGGRLSDPSLGDSPLTFELDPTGTTSPWAFDWTFDSTFNTDPRAGDGGVVFIGGTTAALGVYFNMTLANQSSLSTGTSDLSLHTIPDGSFSGADDYSWVLYSGALGDLSGTSIAVDRNGTAYLGAARSGTGTETQHAGRVYHWPLPGGVADYQQNYGTEDAGNDNQTRGVALETTSPTAPLTYGGFTNTPAGSQVPPVTGTCGVAGGQDGFIAHSTQ